MLLRSLLPTLCLLVAIAAGPRAAAQQLVEEDSAGTVTTVVDTVVETVPAREPGQRLVFVIPVESEISAALHLIMGRALREARDQGADAIVLDMDTPGGEVQAALRIRDLLIDADIPTYTYVNSWAISAGAFIAVATDTIVMGPNSVIGGALPVTIGAEGMQAADAKIISVMAADFRATAKRKGHDPLIAEGFANPDVVIDGVKAKGEILTLDHEQAVALKFAAYQAGSLDELLEREGFAGAQVRRFHQTGTDKVARFLSSAAVLSVLFMIGLAGIFIELKTPGVGLPGLVGIVAMGLAFFGSYLAHLSGYMEIIFFVIGVVLLVVEIYVLPGFGVAGVAGLLMVVGSLFFAMFNFSPEGVTLTAARLKYLVQGPLLTLLVVLIGLIPLLILLARLLPSVPMFKQLALAPDGGPLPHPVDPHAPVEGMQGIAVTDLRPTGVAELDGQRRDVQTDGEFIARRSPVVVTRLEGNRIVVEALPGRP